ncbi:MAG: 5-formyltetrahydrofolate cyclo-ligase [Paludibacteraceae bacterium]|nr:5-formyltetrahydrofolate cyclo-ligase [Paludibacteraceae bacterium]MBQ9704713.1 5-formyltetrahydrofolate cyclo-ligase [Paludibacteraceae bacterium]
MLFESLIHDFIQLLPSTQLKKRKNDMRALLLQKRRILTKEEVAQCSAEVMEQLLATDEYRHARNILLYYPVHHEIDLRGLFSRQDGKTLLLPVTHRNSLELRPYQGEETIKRGRLGIPEPQTPTYKGSVDLIIVPGVGYDRDNRRLGRGGGYYDRFLKRLHGVPVIGVGYAFQLVKEVPHALHDRKVSRVILSRTK